MRKAKFQEFSKFLEELKKIEDKQRKIMLPKDFEIKEGVKVWMVIPYEDEDW